MKTIRVVRKLCEALEPEAGLVRMPRTRIGVRHIVDFMLDGDRAFFSGESPAGLPSLSQAAKHLNRRLNVPKDAATRFLRLLAENGYLNVEEPSGDSGVQTVSVNLAKARNLFDSLCNASAMELDVTIAELIAVAEEAVAAGESFHYHIFPPDCGYNPDRGHGRWALVVEAWNSRDAVTDSLVYVRKKRLSEKTLARFEELAVQSRSGKRQEG